MDRLIQINGELYDESSFKHLQRQVINEQELLLEYYERISEPSDSSVLNGFAVWIYGNDRPQYPPHCHLILGNPRKPEMNIEIHLLDLEAYYMEAPNNEDITWESIGFKIKEGFFKWLHQSNDRFGTNANYLFHAWNCNNDENRLERWINDENKETINGFLKTYLFGQEIPIDKLIESIFEIVFPLYKKNKEAMERLHRITNPIQFAQEVGLPFNFNEFNTTAKVKEIISNYEKMCYNMANFS